MALRRIPQVFARKGEMFWRKKPQPEPSRRKTTVHEHVSKSLVDQLNEAADKLASSLHTYSEAAYKAAQEVPDNELIEARAKVKAARKLVMDGRIAYALGRCIPEHVKHWPSWITRDDFHKWVHFDAQDIAVYAHDEQDGSRNIKVVAVDFTFNQNRYRFVLLDRGMSYVPDSLEKLGEVQLWLGELVVAKFDVIEDLDDEYSEWQFSDVRALRVGLWMKDMIDISTQIEAGRRKGPEEFLDNQTLDAARNIELN
jgi:hypothetical protein